MSNDPTQQQPESSDDPFINEEEESKAARESRKSQALKNQAKGHENISGYKWTGGLCGMTPLSRRLAKNTQGLRTVREVSFSPVKNFAKVYGLCINIGIAKERLEKMSLFEAVLLCNYYHAALGKGNGFADLILRLLGPIPKGREAAPVFDAIQVSSIVTGLGQRIVSIVGEHLDAKTRKQVDAAIAYAVRDAHVRMANQLSPLEAGELLRESLIEIADYEDDEPTPDHPG
jgi:hypothetical protein